MNDMITEWYSLIWDIEKIRKLNHFGELAKFGKSTEIGKWTEFGELPEFSEYSKTESIR